MHTAGLRVPYGFLWMHASEVALLEVLIHMDETNKNQNYSAH